MQVNPAQRILLFSAAAALAVAGAYQTVAPGGVPIIGVGALALSTGLAFVGLRSPSQGGGQGAAQGAQGMGGGAARRAVANGNGNGNGQAPHEDFVQVEKFLGITTASAEGLYRRLVDRFPWDMGGEEEASLPKQIFRESCTILSYYLVCLSLSGGANLALLKRIQHSLKHRTAMYILRLDKRCGPEELADSELCKERSAQGLALIDSFQYLYDATVISFQKKRPFPLNDLIGGIFMLFEGQVSPEEGFWEAKYGDAVYAELAEITRKRRTPA